MKYKNSSSERKLIPIDRIKTWVQPNEVVDLSSIDLRTIGSNGRFMKKVSDSTPIGLPQAKKIPVVEKKEKTPLVKESKPASTKKKKKKEVSAKDLKVQRAKLKEVLESMNKGELYAFGEDNLKIDLKFKDKKDVLVKRVLDAAKKVGYQKILRKV